MAKRKPNEPDIVDVAIYWAFVAAEQVIDDMKLPDDMEDVPDCCRKSYDRALMDAAERLRKLSDRHVALIRHEF